MFKLVKILNSGVNVAEPYRLPTDKNSAYEIGAVAKIDAGTVKNAAATDMPTLIIAESAGAGEKDSILCARINPSMIFECQINSDPKDLKVGDRVTLAAVGSSALGVSATTASGVAEIFDLADAKAAGDTVFVRFA